MGEWEKPGGDGQWRGFSKGKFSFFEDIGQY